MATGMVIFISENQGGPFTPLDSVTDLSATTYVHDTTGTFFYFLQTVADCPGEIPLNSDTLSNQIIQPVEIISVSVEGNGIRIVWRDSDNPNTSDYIIFRATPSGTISLDTLIDTTYLDVGVDVNTIQNYLILTRDVCDQTSIFPEAHNSIVLDTILAPCSNVQEFRINPYTAWLNDSYTIFLFSDNVNDPDPPQLMDSFSIGETLNSADLRNGQTYCTYAVLENQLTSARVLSSEICFVPEYNQLVERLRILKLSYRPGQSSNLQVEWEWNNDASIRDASILIGRDTIPVPLNPSLSTFNQQSVSAAPGQTIILHTTDSCDNFFKSVPTTTATLQVSIDLDNQLSINHSGPQLSDGIQFVSSELLLLNADGSLQSINDTLPFRSTIDLDGNSFAGDELCFLVEYRFRDTTNDVIYTSYGPTQCQQKFPSLFFPNAFSPNGINIEFKPQTKRSNIDGYLLQVYNRYGQKIFESDEVRKGWTGLSENGRPLPSGIE
jgi:hypothetical protein